MVRSRNPPVSPVVIDELTGEVSLRAKADSSGLSVAGKSRFLSAADRLLGGLVGIPAAYLEGIRTKMEIKSKHQSVTLQTNLRKQAIVDSKTYRVVLEKRREKIERGRKQENIESVWIETENNTHVSLETEKENNSNEEGKMNDDWMNVFTVYAEKASSERLRQLWGRILAGEIRRPGMFSLSTMRVIAELDSEIAARFQKAVASRIGDQYLLRPESVAEAEILGLNLLEEVGLLQDVNGMLVLNFEQVSQTDNLYIGGEFSLKFRNDHVKFQIPVITITRTGRDVQRILHWDEYEGLKKMAKKISQFGISVELGSIKLTNGIRHFHLLETIRANSPL